MMQGRRQRRYLGIASDEPPEPVRYRLPTSDHPLRAMERQRRGIRVESDRRQLGKRDARLGQSVGRLRRSDIGQLARSGEALRTLQAQAEDAGLQFRGRRIGTQDDFAGIQRNGDASAVPGASRRLCIDLHRCPAGANGVILQRDRSAEQRQHALRRNPQRLAAVPSHDFGHAVGNLLQDRFEVFGVARPGQRRRDDGRQRGRVLALAGCSRSGGWHRLRRRRFLDTRDNARVRVLGPDFSESSSASRTVPTKRRPFRKTVRIRRCCTPLSPTARRAALIRLVNVDSETIRPSQTAASRSSLLTTRSRFSIRWTRRSNTCGSTGTNDGPHRSSRRATIEGVIVE